TPASLLYSAAVQTGSFGGRDRSIRPRDGEINRRDPERPGRGRGAFVCGLPSAQITPHEEAVVGQAHPAGPGAPGPDLTPEPSWPGDGGPGRSARFRYRRRSLLYPD